MGELIKRFFNGMVFFLAVLTFFLVPLGRKTPAQHVSAIFSTKPAQEAASSVTDAARRLTTIVAAEVIKLRRTAELQSQKPQAAQPPRSEPSRP